MARTKKTDEPASVPESSEERFAEDDLSSHGQDDEASFNIYSASKFKKFERYHSRFNWAADKDALSKDDLHNLKRHRRLVGEPQTEELSTEDVQRIARGIGDHWRICRRYASDRFVGEPVKAVFRGMYAALIFGQNCYVEGSSGTAKTESMRFLCKLIDAPLAEFDASADASDITLVGGEIPGSSATGGLTFSVRRGPILKPGAIGLMIDELPRLPAAASNVLLQAMAERRTTLSLVATGWGDHTFILSPGFFVMGVGNPVGYSGQGERSLALYDRFAIGLWMPHPPSEPPKNQGGESPRLTMYERHATGKDQNVSPTEEDKKDLENPSFTLMEAREAVKKVPFPTELFERLCAISYAVSPDEFLRRSSWTSCPLYEKWTSSEKLKVDKGPKRLNTLRTQVNDYLAEGSNPRGELHVVRNAQILSLMDFAVDDANAKLQVDPRHVAEAFKQANLVRLKPNPGCDEEASKIIDNALALFFPEARS